MEWTWKSWGQQYQHHGPEAEKSAGPDEQEDGGLRKGGSLGNGRNEVFELHVAGPRNFSKAAG